MLEEGRRKNVQAGRVKVVRVCLWELLLPKLPRFDIYDLTYTSSFFRTCSVSQIVISRVYVKGLRRAKAYLMDQRAMLGVRVLVGEGRVLEQGGADRRPAFGADLVPTSDKEFEAGGV